MRSVHGSCRLWYIHTRLSLHHLWQGHWSDGLAIAAVPDPNCYRCNVTRQQQPRRIYSQKWFWRALWWVLLVASWLLSFHRCTFYWRQIGLITETVTRELQTVIYTRQAGRKEHCCLSMHLKAMQENANGKKGSHSCKKSIIDGKKHLVDSEVVLQ